MFKSFLSFVVNDTNVHFGIKLQSAKTSVLYFDKNIAAYYVCLIVL